MWIKKDIDICFGLCITERLSKTTKIAIGASVVSMVVALVGVTMGYFTAGERNMQVTDPH